MDKKNSKGLLMAALICGTIVPALFSESSVYAAEKDEVDEALKGFTLDQIVVTATRTEKRDVDVPADTETYTEADIKAAGGTNLHEVLSRLPGSIFESFGPHGASMGTMSNGILLRGYENGTLVMLNGNPITGRQLYHLEAIPAENIERVEIVKGGGSVLYGSEAVAGVVNIITKKKGNNYVKAGIGSNLRRTYGVGVGDEKFNVYYDGEKTDRPVKRISVSELSSGKYGKTQTNFSDNQRHDAGIRYNINKNLSLNYNYFQNKVRVAREVIETTADTKGGMAVGDPFNYRDYTTKQHVASLNYDDKTWKADLFISSGTIESKGETYRKNTGLIETNKPFYNTKERNRNIGASVQRTWRFGEKSNAILGLDYKREHFQQLSTSVDVGQPGFNRNIFAVYGQWDHKFDAKNELILGARETWTSGASFGGENYNNFSSSLQYIHKLDDNQSIYASIAQSFIMPTLKAMFSKADDRYIPNPGLKPQRGIHYELGWKKVSGVHNWKAALYAMRVKDNISATYKDDTTYTYENKEYRNYGFEFGDTVKGKGKFTYNWAINWMNPEEKNDKNELTKDWDRKYGKFQLTAGVGYHVGKFNANLTGSYLAGRVQKPTSARSYHVSPYLLTTLTANYAPDKNSEFSLTIDNLLDRDDIISHSSSSYYSAPINFLFEYKYKF